MCQRHSGLQQCQQAVCGQLSLHLRGKQFRRMRRGMVMNDLHALRHGEEHRFAGKAGIVMTIQKK